MSYLQCRTNMNHSSPAVIMDKLVQTVFLVEAEGGGGGCHLSEMLAQNDNFTLTTTKSICTCLCRQTNKCTTILIAKIFQVAACVNCGVTA